MHLRENVKQEIYCAYQAQLSTTFLFFQKNKMAVLVKKSFFHNVGPNFHFSFKSFPAPFSTNLAQLSTTFVFSKKQNGGAGKKLFYQNFVPNIYFFQKSFAGQLA